MSPPITGGFTIRSTKSLQSESVCGSLACSWVSSEVCVLYKLLLETWNKSRAVTGPHGHMVPSVWDDGTFLLSAFSLISRLSFL